MTALNPSNPNALRVDVWSDVACPWCYIGKRRLEQALADFPNRDHVEVHWHSFELNSDAPELDPRDSATALASKFRATPEQVRGMLDHVTRTAASVGLEYDFGTVKLANTYRAHQVIYLAAEHGLADEMKERLLRAHFSEGEIVSDTDILARLAGDIGLDPSEVRAAIRDERYARAVRSDEAQAHSLGITGVPFFVLNGKYGISGAQPAEVFRGALQQVWNETHPAPLTILGSNDLADGCEDGSCNLPG